MTSKQPVRGESPMIEQPNQGTSNASKERPAPNGNRAAPKLPPRWFVRAAWMTHRAIHRSTGGRVGLAWPKVGDKLGYLRLKTTGRRTGRERAVILAYIEDGTNLVTLAMNGWADPEPAWWLNLQAHPDAAVDLKRGSRGVRGRNRLRGGEATTLGNDPQLHRLRQTPRRLRQPAVWGDSGRRPRAAAG